MRKFIVAFAILWMTIVFFEYLNKHPIHIMAVQHFKLWTLLISLLLLFAGWFAFNKSKFGQKGSSGYMLVISGFLIAALSAFGFSQRIGFPIELNGIFYPAIKGLFSFLALLLLVVSAYSSGSILMGLLSIQFKKLTDMIMKIALGLMAITFYMFIFGLIGFLNIFTLVPILIIPIILKRKPASDFLLGMFFKPFNNAQPVSTKILLVSYILLAVLTINHIFIQIPFPPGFDSRNYYLNISHLIGDTGMLPNGFQPHNWSLLMSYGFIVFKSAAIAFGVSVLGFYLSLIAAYDLMRNYLKMKNFDALLILLIFAITPSVGNQLFIELKIDFGLLFIQLCSILLILNIYTNNSKIKSKDNWSSMRFKYLILLGICCGFGLGIKLTHLYLLIPLFALIWFIHGQMKGFFAVCALSMFAIFISGFDDLSGMSKYHLGTDIYQWLIFAAGIALMVLMFMKSQTAFMQAFKTSLLVGLIAVFSFSPWVIKNVKDAKGKITVEKLLIGSNPGPHISIQSMHAKYKQSQNK